MNNTNFLYELRDNKERRKDNEKFKHKQEKPSGFETLCHQDPSCPVKCNVCCLLPYHTKTGKCRVDLWINQLAFSAMHWQFNHTDRNWFKEFSWLIILMLKIQFGIKMRGEINLYFFQILNISFPRFENLKISEDKNLIVYVGANTHGRDGYKLMTRCPKW